MARARSTGAISWSSDRRDLIAPTIAMQRTATIITKTINTICLCPKLAVLSACSPSGNPPPSVAEASRSVLGEPVVAGPVATGASVLAGSTDVDAAAATHARSDVGVGGAASTGVGASHALTACGWQCGLRSTKKSGASGFAPALHVPVAHGKHTRFRVCAGANPCTSSSPGGHMLLHGVHSDAATPAAYDPFAQATHFAF